MHFSWRSAVVHLLHKVIQQLKKVSKPCSCMKIHYTVKITIYI